MSEARVEVAGEIVGAIEGGFLVLVAVQPGDTDTDAEVLARKISDLRVFPDDAGRMNRSIRDVGGSVLVVSQFTLAGNVRKGRRPSFTGAADPSIAEPMVEYLSSQFERQGIPAASGRFGAMMNVSLVNDGPVTFVVDVVDGAVLAPQ